MVALDSALATDLADTRFMGKRILVVDDEESIVDAVSYALRREGFKVWTALDADTCIRSFRDDHPNLVILDVMLPSATGFQICQAIRRTSNTPIILLTALSDERSRLQGLGIGADDYITKPFSLQELIARVKAVLRRSPDDHVRQEPLLSAGRIVVDESRHEAFVGDRSLSLSPKEFALLAFFVRNPGIVFSRPTLLDRVWGGQTYIDERTVDVHVRWLRSKIEVDPSAPAIIRTVRGVGYKFAPGAV